MVMISADDEDGNDEPGCLETVADALRMHATIGARGNFISGRSLPAEGGRMQPGTAHFLLRPRTEDLKWREMNFSKFLILMKYYQDFCSLQLSTLSN